MKDRIENKYDDLMTPGEIAQKLGVQPGSVWRVAKRHNLKIDKSGRYPKYSLKEVEKAFLLSNPNGRNKKFITATSTKLFDDFWRLPWDRFIIACDTHVPYINEKFFNLLLEFAQKFKVKYFLHAGDFWNQDQFSTFWIAEEDMPTFSTEVKEAKNVANSLTQVFNDIRFILGSHDIRFWKLMYTLGKAEKSQTIWELLENEKIKVTSYRYCEIGDEWRVNHPKNVVRIGGLPIIRMGAKFGKSIVFGHGHWWGIEQDPSSKHYFCAPGCLCDKKKIPYKNIWDTSHSEWKNGFLYIENNRPHLLDENILKTWFGFK